MSPTSGRARWAGHDTGATTVVFALVVLVLFGVAALGVELTNMYTRDRAVQTTADVAAFAGAQGLPDVCEAFAQALENLNDAGNAVQDDDGARDFSAVATPPAMSNGDPVDGEIEVLRRFVPGVPVVPADRLDTTACSPVPTGAETQAGPGRVVRVTTPGRTVAFAFADVFSAFPGDPAVSSAEVRARATVGLTGGEGASVLPLFLPAGCVGAAGGQALLVVGPAPGPVAPVDPVFRPAGGDDGPTVTVEGPASVPFGSTAPVRVTAAGLLADPTSVPVGFDLHGPDGTTRVPPAVDQALAGVLRGTPQSELGDDGVTRWTASYDVTPGPVVTATSGRWFVRAVQSGTWSPDDGAGSFTVGVEPPPPGDCEGSTTVRYGLLDVPGPVGSRVRAFTDGLRPRVASFAPSQLPVIDTPCVSDGTPPGAILPPRVGATCLGVLGLDAVPDADRPALLTAGLLTGAGRDEGRLASADEVGCTPPRGVPDRTELAGVTVVNSTLSCYLAARPDGSLYDLDDVVAGTAGALREEIFSDPRFAFVPVLGTTARPVAGSWPVAGFRGVFITDETPGSPATCSSATDCNGLVLDSTGSELRQVTSLTFPATALPVSVEQEGNGAPWVAGTKDFLLLE